MKTKAIVTTVLLGFVAASVIYLVAKETRGQPAASMPSTPTSVAQPRQTAMSEAVETRGQPAVSMPSTPTSVAQPRQTAMSEAAETRGQPAASMPSTPTSVAQPRQTAMSEAAETRGQPAASGQSASTSVPQSRETGTPEVAETTKASSKLIAYYFHGNMRCVTCRTIEAYAKEAVNAGFPEALKDGRLELRVVNIEEPANEHFVQDYQLVTRSVVLVEFADGKQEQWKNLARVWELVRDKGAFLKYVQDETRSYLEAAD